MVAELDAGGATARRLLIEAPILTPILKRGLSIMLLHLLTIFMLLCGSGALADAPMQPEPQIPLRLLLYLRWHQGRGRSR